MTSNKSPSWQRIRALCPSCGCRVPRTFAGHTICRSCHSALHETLHFNVFASVLVVAITVVGMMVAGWIAGVRAAVMAVMPLTIGSMLLAAVCWPRVARFRTMTLDQTHCLNCGYDLRGSPGPNCPECGSAMLRHARKREESSSARTDYHGGTGTPPPT